MIRRMAMALGLALPLAPALAGCGYTEIHEVQLRAASDVQPARVDVYLIDQPTPARPVHDMALVQAVGYGSEANMESLVHTLSERARVLGCDALYRVHVEQGYTVAHAFGDCVKYAGPAAAASAPSAPKERTAAPAPLAAPSPPPPPPPPMLSPPRPPVGPPARGADEGGTSF